jgi:hypothetical protein
MDAINFKVYPHEMEQIETLQQVFEFSISIELDESI